MMNTCKKNLKIKVTEADIDHLPPYTSSSHLSTYPSKTRVSSDFSMLSFPDSFSHEDKQPSTRSIKTANTPRATFRPTHCTEPPAVSNSPELDHGQLQHYASIERILRNQNQNLKMQNELLLREVHKLKQSNHKYRGQHRKATLEVEEIRLQCEAQKRRADEMKEIIMSRLAQLQGKIIEGGDGGDGGGFASDCGSILEALTLSESGLK